MKKRISNILTSLAIATLSSHAVKAQKIPVEEYAFNHLSEKEPVMVTDFTLKETVRCSSQPGMGNSLFIDTPRNGSVIILNEKNVEVHFNLKKGRNEINVDRLAKGTYQVKVQDENKRVIGKARLHYEKID